jgi:hypothetical protein
VWRSLGVAHEPHKPIVGREALGPPSRFKPRDAVQRPPAIDERHRDLICQLTRGLGRRHTEPAVTRDDSEFQRLRVDGRFLRAGYFDGAITIVHAYELILGKHGNTFRRCYGHPFYLFDLLFSEDHCAYKTVSRGEPAANLGRKSRRWSSRYLSLPDWAQANGIVSNVQGAKPR